MTAPRFWPSWRHVTNPILPKSLRVPDLRTAFLKLVGNALEPEVFAELDEAVRDDVLDIVDTDTLVNTVQLDSDDGFVWRTWPMMSGKEVLEKFLKPSAWCWSARDFPEDSAGRLMQSEFISVPPFWTVGQTIDYLRETEDLPDDFRKFTLLTHTPIGVVHLAEVLRAHRRTNGKLLHEDFYIIQAETDRDGAVV